ncbi:MAG: ABC transporter ATP-binding protein [Clostridia bacterium]|nr:ABC transporter ATP-binding protein [Clostridia bacterium]
MKKRDVLKNYNPILISEFKRTFPRYFLGILVNGIQATFHFLIPFIIGQILDLLLQDTIIKEEIMNKVYLLILVSCLSLIPRSIYRTLFFTQARISDTKLRKKVIEHLQYVKPEYYERENKGTYLAYISKELLIIRKFLGNFFFHIGKLLLNPVVVLTVITINYGFYIPIVLIPILIIMASSIFKLYKELKVKIENARIADINLFKIIEQNTSGFSLIKLYNEQNNQINKFNEINNQRYEADYSIGMIKNRISNKVDIMYAACYVVVFGLGIILINNNLLTVGGLTALITAITFVISEITSAINPLIDGVAYFKQSTRRYNYFFELEPYKRQGKNLENIEEIRLNRLSYSYDNIHDVLKDIELDIHRGENIGIIGQVGSGKTTLMNILSGFLEVSDNQLLINGVDINEYSRDSIFRNIGYSTQKGIILDDTIYNNINIKEKREVNVERLSKLSDLYSDVIEMDKQFETRIGERGNRLSGGQKQRVQVARTLSDVRSVNIFDDTLSALDCNTEGKVLESIIEETKNDILIVVSNKVSSMKKLDKVYMLIDGKIYDKGTHEELLQRNSLYQEMYNYEKEGDLI